MTVALAEEIAINDNTLVSKVQKLSKATAKKSELLSLLLSNIKYLPSNQISSYNLIFALTFDSNLKELPISKIINSVKENTYKDELDSFTWKLVVHDRFLVYYALLELSREQKKVNILTSSFKLVKEWIIEWKLVETDQRRLFLLISECVKDSDVPLQYEYLIKHLVTFKTVAECNDSVKELVRRAIKLAINSPTIYHFQSLSSLVALKSLESSSLVEFAQIYFSKSVVEYESFIKKHPNFIKEQGFNKETTLKKIKTLTLVSESAAHLGESVAISALAKKISVSEDEVEFWVIDAIHAKLLEAKINQLNNTVHISRVYYRNFGTEQWKKLQNVLNEWKGDLNTCLSVLEQVEVEP
ncbi:hypothetical protein HDV02_003925 [Globomyces sp. JEL0801]|nr:hypothetical protein HDV02_003925 [Globomyces sp. JEL0801]